MYSRMKRRHGFVSAVSASLSVLLICSALAMAAAKESQAPLNVDVDSHAVSKLRWEGCGAVSNHTLECSRIEVPMDHFNNSFDKTFSIPLIRLLATNASATGDRHVIFNFGGPGASGVTSLRGGGGSLIKIIGEQFHLLSYDPRGVNGSIPRARCYPSAPQRKEAFLSNPWNLEFQAGEMFTSAENKAKACEETTGEHGAYVNTPQTAADMNSILDAIDQEKMYYWGFSYGTTLGQTYAQMFPDRVSRLIIDGVSNLDEWYNAFFFEEAFTDTDRIFSGFLEECFKAKEACPLNSIRDISFTSASELKSYIGGFLKNLEEEPIPVYLNNSNYGSITRRKVVTNGIFMALYRPAHWPSLASNLADLLNGNSAPVYNAYSDSLLTHFFGVDDTETFIIMNDNWRTGLDAPAHGIFPIRNYTIDRPALSNLVSKYQSSDIFDRASWSIPTTHSFHPKYHPKYPRVKTAEPILVVSATYDPVCPLVSARKAHDSFEGAGFVEQKSYGHCSIGMPSLCTANHIRRYFNEGVLPKAGATCGIDAEYFPGAGESHTSVLSVQDEELLAALRALGAEDFVRPFLPVGKGGF